MCLSLISLAAASHRIPAVLLQATNFACKSDGSAQADLNSRHALLRSLAQAAVHVRTAVAGMHEPGAVVKQLLHSADRILGMGNGGAQGTSNMASPDVVMTNWAQLGHQKVDFGSGPANFTGHFGYKPSPIVILPDTEGYLIVLDGVLSAELARLRASSVLPQLLPLSTLCAASL